ncbi:HAD family hydrolase [Mangrovimonas spongiae]|uniref:HAD family hydrolase n=1 Tax=Mangrovimonas spongiae TaxID=2494697 RepID=A0A428JZ35_9FLAO|nr:HAD family hydrolase [Mangrovimonas spongiae]RSK39376.1 HAD family hydrolase [Mangrovimonas spongiae]
MNLSQVKLVVTDMDGTLLNSKGQVSEEFFSLFKMLQKHNVHFIAASGRQYHSIVSKLNDIKEDITIIAENGGLAKRHNTHLHTNYFPNNDVQKIIPFLRNINDAHIVLCGEKAAYIESKDEAFITMFNEYYTEYKIVDNLTKVSNDNFLKIAVYSFGGSEENLYPHFKPFEDIIQVKISGSNWMDLSHIDTNKGYALQKIQHELDVSPSETIVFGDYNNDLEMLQLSEFSFAMQNAHPNVKQTAKYETKSNDDGGVEFILKKLIKDKESLISSGR